MSKRMSAGTRGPGPCTTARLLLSRWLFALAAYASLCFLAARSESASASSGTWAVPEAILKFTIEADPNRPPVPSIPLSRLKAKKGPSALRNPDKSGWSGAYYRLDGQIYKSAIALSCPETATYPHKAEYRRFVALVGVKQDASSSAAVVFEVYADGKKLHSSPPVGRQSSAVGIDVRLPANAKEIRLATTGGDLAHRRHAYWVNAGFLTKEDHARVGHMTLPVCGYDPSEYEAAVFTFNGIQVGSKMLGAPDGGQMEGLFFAGHGWSAYDVYLVPKDKYKPPGWAWQADAGLVLETRRADKGARAACRDLAGLRKVWNNAAQTVGCSLVNSIHHGYPVHPRLIASKDRSQPAGLALYRYTGFFETPEAGQHIFSIASNWGSYLLVDGKEVVSWLGEHDYRKGIRGEKKGHVVLQPGIHRIEYLNYSPPGTMLTLVAWKPPGGTLGVMTRSDFPSVRRFSVKTGQSNPLAGRRACFAWDVVDDWRLDRDKMALILMRFQAVSPAEPGDYDFRWLFGNGVVKAGAMVESLFSSAGRHTVTVQMLDGGQVVDQAKQTVQAGTLAEKIWVDARDRRAFEREMSQADLRKMSLDELVNLYAFSAGIQEEHWTQATREVLIARADELIAQEAYHTLCLELAQYVSAPAMQNYDRALALCTGLREKAPDGSQIKQKATILAGELLVRCLGQYDRALQLLNPARWEQTRDRAWAIRLGLARAEALLALARMEEVRQQIDQLQDRPELSDVVRREVRHAGLLRRASELANEASDATEMDSAMDTVLRILLEEPKKLLSPGLNLVRLDLHLARGEYAMARLLAERLANLELTSYDRVQVLTRHIRALCATGDLDSARTRFEMLTQIAPDSPEALAGRTAIVEAVMATRRSQ